MKARKKYIRPIMALVAAAYVPFAFTACRSAPDYRGEGHILNTTSRREGSLLPSREYTLTLVSFGLNTNSTHEFYLGNVAFFGKTLMTAMIFFPDKNQWLRVGSSGEPRGNGTYSGKRDITALKARLN
jgi:hypothetical protein